VEIARRPDGMLGTLRIVDGAGTERRRSLKASRCDDMVESLALVAAVALDSDTSAAPTDAPPAENPPTATPPPPAASSSATPVAPPAPPDTAAPPRPPAGPEPNSVIPDRVDSETQQPRRGSTTRSWNALAGIGAGALFGQAPEALAAFMLLAGVEWNDSPWWSPSLRVSIVQSVEGQFAEPGGTAHYRLTLGMVEACPFRFGPTMLALRTCWAGSGGVATISGSEAIKAESHTRWRWHVGASALMSIRVGNGFAVTADAGFLAAFRRDRYGFTDPSGLTVNTFFSDPAVSGFARLDVSVAFP
jgi:hypothetical protein